MMCKEHVLSVYTPPFPDSSNNFEINSSKYLNIYLLPCLVNFQYQYKKPVYLSCQCMSGENPLSKKNKSQR